MWIPLIGPLAVALAALLIPGLLVSLTAGQRGFHALALAPVLSVTAISMGAVAGSLIGIPWGWWSPAAMALTMAIVAGVAQRLFRQPPAPGAAANVRREPVMWLALALAVILLGRHVRNVLDRPDSFSQTFDNIFHLSAIRYIADTGNASSLTVGQLTAGGDGMAFYPAAFHDTVSLVLQVAPASITLATNAVLVVTVALVWPLSSLFLVRMVLRASWPTMVAAGVLTASFTAFPLLLLNFGVLYPNLFGLAILPALLALLVQWLSLGQERRIQNPVCALLLALGLPGLALAHPNTLMVLVAVAGPLFAVYNHRALAAHRLGLMSRRSLVTRLVALGIFALFTAVAWRYIRPADEHATWEPLDGVPDALGQALLNAPDGARAAWMVSALAALGLLSAHRHGLVWLASVWSVLVGLWLVVAGFVPSELRTYLTGIWYNDPRRFSATLPLAALPLAALGVQIVSHHLLVAWRRFPGGGTRERQGRLAVTVLLAGLLVLGTQRAAYMNEAVENASSLYAVRPDSPLVTTDENTLIQRIPTLVPADAVIATNPWNGSSMVYALTGHPTTTTHIFYDATPDLAMIRDHLDEAASKPAACEAAERLGVQYALDFGPQEVHFGTHPYPGLDELAEAPGFRLVAREGAAALYELVGCG